MRRLILLLFVSPNLLFVNAMSKMSSTELMVATEVVFEQNAVLYLKFFPSQVEDKYYYLTDGDTFICYLDVIDNTIIYDQLSPGKEYTVYEEADFENIALYTFNTREEHNGPVYVSDLFLEILGEYDKLYENLSFYKYVCEIIKDEIDYLEKLAFIQKFYFNGASFKNLSKNEFPDFEDVPMPPEGDCNCQYVLNVSQNPNISTSQNPVSYNSSGGKIKWDSKSSYWFSTLWFGPTKEQKLNSEGKRSHSKSFNYESSGLNNQSYTYFELGYLLRCLNYLDLPRDCQCEKEVTLRYQYDTGIEAQNKLPSCFLCGSKGSEASGEDWAILSHSIDNSTTNILAAGNARLETHCKANWNKDWWLNI